MTARTYGIDEALAELGVTAETLTDAERSALDDDGYVILPDMIDAGRLEEMRARYEYLMEQEGASAGKEVHQEAGTRRLSDLVNNSCSPAVKPSTPRQTSCWR